MSLLTSTDFKTIINNARRDKQAKIEVRSLVTSIPVCALGESREMRRDSLELLQ